MHTHYDGQASWDETLTPSSWHGVTTAVLGNCGVGFAPVRGDRHEYLVQLMEGVEDIPGTALHEGITWEWETFPEYLDALDRMPRSLDIAAQVPHGALRTYVMDERGAEDVQPTDDELARMAELVEESVRAGAVGLSTNRLASHTAKDGRPVPGTFANDAELDALGAAMARAGGGVLEIVSSEGMGMVPGGYHADVDLAARFSLAHGLPVSLCLSQVDTAPDLWRDVLGWIEEHRAQGADVSAQVAGRPLGILLGLTTKHVFQGRAAYDEIDGLPLAEQVAALADPERRRRILDDPTVTGLGRLACRMPDKAFPMGDTPDYEPDPASSVAAIAAASGTTVEEVFYDQLLVRDGKQLVLFTLGGYANRNLDHVHDMVVHPDTVIGLADGGAHVALDLRRVRLHVAARLVRARAHPWPARPARGRGGEDDRPPGRAVRLSRPRGDRGGQEGRSQRGRRRPPPAPSPRGGARPSDRRATRGPEGRRLHRHDRERRGHTAGRCRHRRPSWRSGPAPRAPLTRRSTNRTP